MFRPPLYIRLKARDAFEQILPVKGVLAMERTAVNMLLPDLGRSCDVLKGRKGVLPSLRSITFGDLRNRQAVIFVYSERNRGLPC